MNFLCSEKFSMGSNKLDMISQTTDVPIFRELPHVQSRRIHYQGLLILTSDDGLKKTHNPNFH